MVYTSQLHTNIILPVALYGCEAWSLTLREERRLRVFESRVLRKIFVPKRDEVTGEWRKLHNEELYDQYSSAYIIRVIESRRMRWAGHVARVGNTRLWRTDLREREHLEGLGVDGRTILKLIFKKYMWAWIGFIWLRIAKVAGACECYNELAGPIKCG